MKISKVFVFLLLSCFVIFWHDALGSHPVDHCSDDVVIAIQGVEAAYAIWQGIDVWGDELAVTLTNDLKSSENGQASIFDSDFEGVEENLQLFVFTLTIRLKVMLAVIAEIVPAMSDDIFFQQDRSATLIINDILVGFEQGSKNFILDWVARIIQDRLAVYHVVVLYDHGAIAWEYEEAEGEELL